eukprot:TRINITY_DN41968_c0_g1_i12.p1 TRINITY_DN41968_c0_g1~~TRINITY_DN41968_c0_g1_i12.p1  ORF type:complete len:101 (+),score=15.04 TRINITY_DN41968_c0_g1_i12:187-489(+)
MHFLSAACRLSSTHTDVALSDVLGGKHEDKEREGRALAGDKGGMEGRKEGRRGERNKTVKPYERYFSSLYDINVYPCKSNLLMKMNVVQKHALKIKNKRC